MRERLAQLDEGVPPATGTLNYVIPRAAGPVRRLGLQQLSVDQTRNSEASFAARISAFVLL